MPTTDGDLTALFEMDRFVRLMAVAPGQVEVVRVVRAYLSSWSRERIIRLQASDAGWVPFDERQEPFRVSSIEDVRQIRGSVRIRCRELEASGAAVARELLELDLFFFFANESLEAHESPHGRRAYAAIASSQQSALRPLPGGARRGEPAGGVRAGTNG